MQTRTRPSARPGAAPPSPGGAGAAPGPGHALAVTEAAVVGLPLAVAAWWLAIRLTRGAR